MVYCTSYWVVGARQGMLTPRILSEHQSPLTDDHLQARPTAELYYIPLCLVADLAAADRPVMQYILNRREPPQ